MIFLLFNQYYLPEALFNNNFYELALIEYKRVFFFDTTAWNEYQLRLHYTISLLYQDFLLGYEEIEKLLIDFPESERKSRIALGKALIDIKKYGLAIDLLKPIAEQNSAGKKLIGFAYLFNQQYRNAIDIFQEVDSNFVRKINEYAKKSDKSTTRAMLLSAIIPGLGEIYAGDIKRGLQGFVLNFLSGFLLFNSIKNKEYVDAGIIFSLAFNRFYFGSITNASRIAHEMNERSKRAFLQEIRDEYYRGIYEINH
ncbi:MAG: hypothetical protein N3A65_01010 [candidate division WOR-3 bacterium]|nr:hypothetical protein [candidate division WOR-3 bacterium]